jgi:hypothetical protein
LIYGVLLVSPFLNTRQGQADERQPLPLIYYATGLLEYQRDRYPGILVIVPVLLKRQSDEVESGRAILFPIIP